MFVLDDIITRETNNIFWKNSKIRANYNIVSSANDNLPSKLTNNKHYTLNINNNKKNKSVNNRRNNSDSNRRNNSDSNRKNNSVNNRKNKSINNRKNKSDNYECVFSDLIDDLKNLNINCYKCIEINYNEEIKETKENFRNFRRIYHRGKDRNRKGEKRAPKNCSRV